MAGLSKAERLELDLESLAIEHDMVIIKKQDVTGCSYKLLNPDDAAIYLLNQWQPTERLH